MNRLGPGQLPVIDYLRISVTDRCNFRCKYCMPEGGIELRRHEDILSYEEITRFTQAAVATGVSRVRVTGGEPLVRPGVAGLIEQLASLRGVRDLSLTTNGSLLGGHAADLWAAGLRRINISIDSLDPVRFSQVTGGHGLDPVLAGIDLALATGFEPVKVNAVMLEGIEDELPAFIELARRLPVHVRFIEQMPIGRLVDGPWQFVTRDALLERMRDHGELQDAVSPQGGGPAVYHRFAGAAGTIGFISSMSSHFCGSCNRLRLTADGMLRNCLFSDEEIDVRAAIAAGGRELIGVIRDSMNSKRFDRRTVTPGPRAMAQIGG